MREYDYGECTGEKGILYEDTKDWCLGWRMTSDPNCTKAPEFEYESADQAQSATVSAVIKTFGGGGYVLRLRGYITDMEKNIELLKKENWIDNRTRSLILEFSAYNAQVGYP